MTADAVSRPPWVMQASSVLWTAADGNWDDAHRQLQALVDEHSSDVVPDVMVSWAMTAMHYCGIDQDPDRVLGMMFVNANTGEMNTVNEVPPPVRWAGRFLVAIATRDKEQAEALVHSVDSDQQFSDNVAAMLNICGSLLGMVMSGNYPKV